MTEKYNMAEEVELSPEQEHRRIESVFIRSKVLTDVWRERRRQINEEGWSIEHDDAHTMGELAQAAACYADPRAASEGFWPWDGAWYKPKTDREDYVRAAALLLAEIERLDRKEASASVR